jgi:hypothetical protein
VTGPLFLLFAGDEYEPDGGWGDNVGGPFETLEAALDRAGVIERHRLGGWWHIVELVGLNARMVASGRLEYGRDRLVWIREEEERAAGG